MRRDAIRLVLLMALGTAFGALAEAQQPSLLSLTIGNAVTMALKNNLGVQLAAACVDETTGTRERRLALLLPCVDGDSLINRQNRNLAVAGICVPGLPTAVGPFFYADFRVSAGMPLVERQAYHTWKASQKQEQAAEYDYQDARDLVTRQAVGLYLQSVSAAAEVQAGESRVATSQRLEKLAQDQHANGLATGVDVARAQVQLARDRQTLLIARDTYQTSLLVLARFLGLRPGTPMTLAERLQFRPVALLDVDQMLPAALAARLDYRALAAQRDALVQQEKASWARALPKFSISGDYGALGSNFGEMPGTGEVQATLSISLFDRDRNGKRVELASQLRRLDEQMNDLSLGIEEELRKAVLDLQSSEEQVSVTEAALNLAQRELTLAEDRFRNGVTDTIEVVTAQDALARAQDDLITALAQHADAAMALARALGASEKGYRTYLGEP
jgi:outer membrane protein TolC